MLQSCIFTKMKYIFVYMFLFNIEHAKTLFKTFFWQNVTFEPNNTLFCKFMQNWSKSQEKRFCCIHFLKLPIGTYVKSILSSVEFTQNIFFATNLILLHVSTN